MYKDDFWSGFSKKQGIEKKETDKGNKYWEGQSRNLLIPKDALIVGEDKENLSKAYLSLDFLNTHLHVIGQTGVGKSCFLELLCRSLISRKQGLCLIDPHGFLYDNIVSYLSYYPDLAKQIILFNLADKKPMRVGFNPMAQNERVYGDIRKQIDINTSGVAKVWDEESKNTPTLRHVLTNTFFPIIEGGYTIIESEYFTRISNPWPRQYLAGLTSKERVREDWIDFETLTRTKKFEMLTSAGNRIPEFTDPEVIRLTFGQTENVLDVEDIIENKKILLVNLSQRGPLSQDSANLAGVFLINELFYYALTRTEQAGREKPFYLVIDEFQNFLSPDTAGIMDQCRKFGLHMILSHQRLSQLKRKGEDIYDAVKDGARNKLVFSISHDDSELLLNDLYAGQIDLKEIKQELYRTTLLNHREEIRLVKGHASPSGFGSSEAGVSGGARSSGQSDLSSQMIVPGLVPDVTGITKGTGSFSNTVDTWSKASGFTDFSSDTDIETEVPMLIPELGQELASREFYNLEEQRYKKAVGLVSQPNQHAVLKLSGNLAKHVKIKTLLPYPKNPDKIKKVEEISYKHQKQYYLPAEDRKALVEARQDEIKRLARELETENIPTPKLKTKGKIK